MANGIVLNLDTTKSEFQNPMIVLRQGDGNYQSLNVTVTSNGEPFNLTGWTTTFMGTTAGGFKIVDGAVSLTNSLQGEFTYTPNKAWGQDQGEYKNAYFKFVKSDQTASSAAFRVTVLDAVDITAEEARDYISIVDKTIDKLTSDIAVLENSVTELKNDNISIRASDNNWSGKNLFTQLIDGYTKTKTSPSTDLNLILTPGKYELLTATSYTNLPSGIPNNAILIVENNVDGSVNYQRILSRDTASPNTDMDMFFRLRVLNTWTNWQRVAKDGEIVHKFGAETVDGPKTFTSPIIGDVTGNSATTTKLKTPIRLNGVWFDGTHDLTISGLDGAKGDKGDKGDTGSSALPVAGVYTTLSALNAANPPHTFVYITTDNGNWNYWNGTAFVPGGIYQSTGLADNSVTPQKLYKTFIQNNKASIDFVVASGNSDLYIIDEPIQKKGILDVVGKFKTSTQYFFLLKKTGNVFTVLDKEVKSLSDGIQNVNLNFKVSGDGTEYIGVLGGIYFNYSGGSGFYNLSKADVNASSFTTSQHIDGNMSLYTTITDEKLVEEYDKLYDVMPINKFKNGIKDFSKDNQVSGGSSTYIYNEQLKSGNIIVHLDSSTNQNGIVYILKKNGLNFDIVSRVAKSFKAGENVIDMNYYASGDGTEYIGHKGTIKYASTGGTGFYEVKSPTPDNVGNTFTATDNTTSTLNFGVYPEYQSDIDKRLKYLENTRSQIELTDFTMPKYLEVSGSVGFVGRWFDKTIGGVATKTTINQGSEFYFKVKNTTTINVNFVPNTALKTPVFAYSIDGVPMTRQLTTAPTLPTVTTGEHIVRIVVEALDEHEDKWNGEKGVSFRDVTVDNGGVVTGVLPKNRKIMFFGDSITEGIRVLNMNADPDGNSATGAFPYIASSKLNAISYRVGFGASGITTGGSGYVPKTINNIDKMTASRDTPFYDTDVIVLNLGTNDGKSTSANFITGYNEVLDRLNVKYSGTPIFVILPFNGAKRSEILQVVSGRTNVYLIDTYGWNVATTDGTHPNKDGSITAGNYVAESIKSVLGKEFFI